jgi:hypothetical protein
VIGFGEDAPAFMSLPMRGPRRAQEGKTEV